MADGRNPCQDCQNGSKNSLEFCHVNKMKSSFVSFEQRPQIAENEQGCQMLETTSEKAISS